MDIPQNVKTIGIIHLVSGILNLTVGWGCASLVLTMVCGVGTSVVTLGMCPIGVLCGFLPYALLPFGIVELVGGILMMTGNPAGGQLGKYLPYIEIGSLLFGGLGSAIAGGVALSLRDDETLVYLEG